MNYEAMSDFEINREVASYAAESGWLAEAKSPRSDSELILKYQNGPGCTRNKYMDYCNNPTDAWPIIHGNGIGLFEHDISGGGKTWTATTNLDKSWLGYGTDGFDYTNKNPLRAAMIVYLMMHEQSHNCPPADC